MTQVPRVDGTDQFLDQELEGRYRIVERLGSGGMSTVYRAQQMQGGPDVAVKLLHDELIHDQAQRERFEREARALFGLEHPNVLHVHDYGVHEGLPFLVMELLAGQTLDQLVEEGPLQPHDAVSLVCQVLAGLSKAHEMGILHRDIKTENVVVVPGPNGTRVAKLLDFGLVKFVDDDRWGEGRALTAFGEVFGTPAYMSPEQCTGEPAEASSDVYSMGVVLFELLTGDWPFMEESRAEMMRAHLTQKPPALTEVAPDLEPRPELVAVIDRALQKDKDARFVDAAAMRDALLAIPEPVAAVKGAPAAAQAAPAAGVGIAPAPNPLVEAQATAQATVQTEEEPYSTSAMTDPMVRNPPPIAKKGVHPLVWIAAGGAVLGLLVVVAAALVLLFAAL